MKHGIRSYYPSIIDNFFQELSKGFVYQNVLFSTAREDFLTTSSFPATSPKLYYNFISKISDLFK